MPETPFVSIIIVNFNGRQWLKECLSSVEALNYPRDRYEVIVGDNASTDDSVAYVREDFPQVRVRVFDENYGFCRTNNLCAREAKGDYLVFLNNDTYVTADWLKSLVEGVLSEPGVVSCASKMFFPQLGGGKVINSAGGVFFPSGGGLYEGWMEEDADVYKTQKYTGYGCGAGVLVETRFFLETGGFDEYYFYSIEEIDLGFRAWMYGYKVLFVPDAVMYHYMGQTGFRGKGTTPTIEFLINRNTLYFILKNFAPLTAIKALCLFSTRTALKLAYSLYHRKFRVATAILKAHITVTKDLKRVLRSRQSTQKSREVSDGQLRRMGVLVSVRDSVRRSRTWLRNMKRYSRGNLYDAEDTVKLHIGKEGETVFYRT